MKKRKPSKSATIIVRVTEAERRWVTAQQREDESFSDAVRRLLLRPEAA